MDAIELGSRHRTTPYEAVAQDEGDSLNFSATNEIPSQNEPGSTTTSNHSYLITRREHARNRSQNRVEHLPAKKYTKSGTAYCCLAVASLVGIIIPIIILFSIFASAENPTNSIGGLYTTFCTDLEANSAIIGPIQDILDIDFAFWDLSFSQAKLIDLVWDIGFSRGGQLFLGWITYKVHTAAMLRVIETDRVSCDLFTTIAFSSPSLRHLRPLWATMSKLQGSQSLLLWWMILSTLWVISWPTLTNALTGYIASKDTAVKLLDGPGYMNYSTIANPKTLAFQYINLLIPDPTQLGGFAPIGPVLTNSGPNISLWDYLNSIVQNKTALPDPNAQTWLTKGFDVGNNTAAVPIFYYNNQSYVYDYFQSAAFVQCTIGGSYQWGFSFGVLFYFIILNGLWVVGTYGVWIHLYRKSRFVRNRPIGIYRAILDMAEVIHKDLGNNLCAYTDDKLEYELRKLPGVRCIVEDGSPGHIGLTSKEEDTRAILSYEKEYGRTKKQS